MKHARGAGRSRQKQISQRKSLSKKASHQHHRERQKYREMSFEEAEELANTSEDDLAETASKNDSNGTDETALLADADWEWTDDDQPDSGIEGLEGGLPDLRSSGEPLPPDDSAERKAYAIYCFEGKALFVPPSWSFGRHRAASDYEQSLRFLTYDAVARWLGDHRTDFLREPSLLNYSKGTIDLGGPLAVTQEGLWKLCCQDGKPDYGTFTRHLRELALVWPDRTMGISILFTHAAKTAWAACAVLAKLESLMPAERARAWYESVKGQANIPPRSREDANTLRAVAAKSPSPVEYMQLVCLLADCTWRKVRDEYDALFDSVLIR